MFVHWKRSFATLKTAGGVPRAMRLVLVLVMLLAAPLLAGCAEEPSTATPTSGSPTPTATATASPSTAPPTGDKPPAPTSAPQPTGKSCVSYDGAKESATVHWVLSTSMGTIRVVLFCDKTPITAQNFVQLTESGYFDGTKFHRVIANFMNQGGDPLSKDDAQAARWGTGGPGYRIKDEFYCADGSVSNANPANCATGLGLKHDTPGVISMANSGPGTGGSQFFLTAVATPWLDGKHAIFGHTADQESLDVVLAINAACSPKCSGDRPSPPIVIERAVIEWG